MDDNLRAFLEKFAELERRVRKLAAEDRALRQEVKALRDKAVSAEAETGVLRDLLLREKGLRLKARDHLDDLIARLDGIKGAAPGTAHGLNSADPEGRGDNGGARKAGAAGKAAEVKVAEAVESEL
ncbi:MAG TPA: hypothetical protein VM658_21790 [bacterium]|nr:hypothetical protein [bacterium]